MKNHHEVGYFKNRLMILLLSFVTVTVMSGQALAATTCSSCHGMPPIDSGDGSRDIATGAFKGSHQTHLGASAAPSECTKCHGNVGYDSAHSKVSGNKINMAGNVNSSPVTGAYSKVAPFDQSSNPTLGTCSNVNCHFETITPVWGTSAASTSCSSCHNYPPTTGTHGKHIGAVANGSTIGCSTCHPDYGTSSFSHATSAGKHKIVVNTVMQYTGGTTISWLPSQPDAFGSCQNISCHSNGPVSGGVNVVYQNPTWGTPNTVGCAFCHPNLGGKHSVHVKLAQLATAVYGATTNNSAGTTYDFGCGSCHPTDKNVYHINGTVDITLNSTHGGTLKSKNNTNADNSGYVQNLGVSVTCAAAYCHSNGMATPTFYGANVDWYEASYSGDKCARCHGNSPNTGGKVGSNAHTAHVVGIHYDDIFNGVSKKLPQSGGQTVNAAHGAANRSTTISCNICHAATVTTAANDKNTFCSGCHDGVTPPGGSKNPANLIADKSMHVNGSVDVVFVNQKIATKAQVAVKAFAAYTSAATGGWSRNNNIYKSYTSGYDVTKQPLSASVAYSQVAGCAVACHSNNPVKWTDSVTCNSCHTRLK